MQFELAPKSLRATVAGIGIILLSGSIVTVQAMALPSDEGPEEPTQFECPVGIGLAATFTAGKSPSVRVEIGENVWTLPRVPSANGTKYSDGFVTFWIKGGSARFESPELSMSCSAAAPSTTGLKALTAQEWRLVSVTKNGATASVPDDVKIDAAFEDGRVAGGGVCNRYFASFRASQDQTISIGEIGATLITCPDHAEFERQYFRMLKASTRYDVRNGVLDLSSPDGSLRFVEVQ